MERIGLGGGVMVNDGGVARNDEARDVAQADAMMVVQLKDELRRHKLKTADNKAELVERFRAAMLLEGQKDRDASDDDDGVHSQVDCESGGESKFSDASEGRGEDRYVGCHKDVRDVC